MRSQEKNRLKLVQGRKRLTLLITSTLNGMICTMNYEIATLPMVARNDNQ